MRGALRPSICSTMSTRPNATANVRLAECLVILDELVRWADADAEHAAAHDAPETVRDDRRRARALRRARAIIEACRG
jgi:hypothetical protein